MARDARASKACAETTCQGPTICKSPPFLSISIHI
jgi:hypothetical protein